MVVKIQIKQMPKVTVALIFYQQKHLVLKEHGFPGMGVKYVNLS